MRINVFEMTALAKAEKAAIPLLKKAVSAALAGKAGAKDEVNLVLVDGDGIRRLNAKFLGKKRLTDVIAFNYPRPAFRTRGEETPFGDIFVCVPVARRQGAKCGHGGADELLVLAAHGGLHLSGMDDSTAALRRGMDEAAAAIIARLKPGCGKLI